MAQPSVCENPKCGRPLQLGEGMAFTFRHLVEVVAGEHVYTDVVLVLCEECNHIAHVSVSKALWLELDGVIAQWDAAHPRRRQPPPAWEDIGGDIAGSRR